MKDSLYYANFNHFKSNQFSLNKIHDNSIRVVTKKYYNFLKIFLNSLSKKKLQKLLKKEELFYYLLRELFARLSATLILVGVLKTLEYI